MIKIKKTMAIAMVAALTIPTHYFCSQAEKTDQPAEVEEEKKSSTVDAKQRGAYIVNTGGCVECHSPKIMTAMGPVPDSSRILSGHPSGSPLPAITYDATKPGGWILFAPDLTAAVGPWGISYSANLTPDSTTGLGNWTVDMFKKALKTGKHMGDPNGRQILPPMPWPETAKMTDEDLEAIFAYLQSIPAIKNQVPMPTPPMEVKVSK